MRDIEYCNHLKKLKNMKRIFLTLSILLISYCAFSQVDTTARINTSLNVSRCNCTDTFGTKLKKFRETKQVQPDTMRLFLSSIATHYTKREITYSLSEYTAIENGDIELDKDLQMQILRILKANEQY